MSNRNNQVLFTPTQKAPPAVADLGSFYRVYKEKKTEHNASSGDNTLTLNLTPAGYIRIVTAVLAYDYSSGIDTIKIGVSFSGLDIWLKSVLNVSAHQGIDYSAHIFLGEGDCMEAKFYGCIAGDLISIYALGYDIKEY